MASLKTHHIIVLLSGAVLALVLGLWAGSLNHNGQSGEALALQRGTALVQAPRPLPDFTLQDHNAKAFDKTRLQQHWTLFFFGYTHCPDVCPTTLAMLAQAMDAMQALQKSEHSAPIQVVFVSVDPQRDTLEALKGYTTYYHPDFIGATGTQAQLERLTKPLGILFLTSPDPNNKDNYLVDHSASILVVGPNAQFQALLSPPHAPQIIVADLREVIRYVQQHNAR